MGNFIKIECFLGGSDDELFTSIVNQGIDGYLEAFTKSEFTVKSITPMGHQRRILNFHVTEMPILLRRLRELQTGEADQWAEDIEMILGEENNG